MLNIEQKIETTRDILYEAIKAKASKKTILKISQKLDKYIVKYLLQNFGEKRNLNAGH